MYLCIHTHVGGGGTTRTCVCVGIYIYIYIIKPDRPHVCDFEDTPWCVCVCVCDFEHTPDARVRHFTTFDILCRILILLYMCVLIPLCMFYIHRPHGCDFEDTDARVRHVSSALLAGSKVVK